MRRPACMWPLLAAAMPDFQLDAAQNGQDCVVLVEAELGFGASTRNGGGAGSGVNIDKNISGKTLDQESQRALRSDGPCESFPDEATTRPLAACCASRPRGVSRPSHAGSPR
jgi:glycine/D-amino acid oxidase-like deaminating enzyme